MRKQRKFVIGILTCEAHADRDAACRSTWVHSAHATGHVDCVFIIGKRDIKFPRLHGDILYVPCPDDYASLTQKTRWFCAWALQNYDFEYLFKCDNDTFIEIGRLLQNEYLSPVVGYDDGDHFHGGAGYTIRPEAATAIAVRLDAEQGLEDWKARDAIRNCGLDFTHDSRFRPWKDIEPEPHNSQITAHYVPPLRMRMLYDEFRFQATDKSNVLIPKVLHFIWLGSDIPERYRANVNKWKELNPEYSVRIWRDVDMAEAVTINRKEFQGCVTMAQKSHIARYEILKQYGGIYIDCDVDPLRPLGDLADGLTGFSGAEDENNSGVAVIGATPEHSFINRLVEQLPESLRLGGGIPTTTGSHFLTRNLVHNRNWRVFHWKYFYPIHFNGSQQGNLKFAYCNHLWAASWQGKTCCN